MLRALLSKGARLLPAIVLGVLAAWGTAAAFHPRFLLGEDVVVVLVTDSCPIATAVVVSTLQSDVVRRHLVPVPTAINHENEDSKRFREAACGAALEHLHREASWSYLAPDGWLCEQLENYGDRIIYRKRFTGHPVFLRDEAPLELEVLDAYLLERGLERKRKGIDLVGRSEEEEPASVASTVRGSSIGF